MCDKDCKSCPCKSDHSEVKITWQQKMKKEDFLLELKQLQEDADIAKENKNWKEVDRCYNEIVLLKTQAERESIVLTMEDM